MQASSGLPSASVRLDADTVRRVLDERLAEEDVDPALAARIHNALCTMLALVAEAEGLEARARDAQARAELLGAELDELIGEVL